MEIRLAEGQIRLDEHFTLVYSCGRASSSTRPQLSFVFRLLFSLGFHFVGHVHSLFFTPISIAS